MTITWTDELTAEICEHLASGMSMLEVANLPGFPSAPSIYRRMHADADFDTAIARARAAQQDCEADRCIEMADAATVEDYQVVKLRIWARQWRAAKLAPKRYGDKMEHSADSPLLAAFAALMAISASEDPDNDA